jgi:Flp pilus assembly pilin Flp
MEYVIIIVIVALAALVVIGAFSDRIRNLFAGVTNTLGGNAETVSDGQSVQDMKDLQGSGLDE